MATVQVDLSEYDMLREAKNKAEAEVKELRNTIQGIENNSRVIIKTAYKYPYIDINNIVKRIRDLIIDYKDFNDIRQQNTESWCTGNTINYKFDEGIYNKLYSIIKENIEYNCTFNIIENQSSQYINFDDVKCSVEEHYKKEINETINRYKETINSYNKLKKDIENKIRKKYIDRINQLAETLKRTIEERDNFIKDMETKISKLNNTIKESRTKIQILEKRKKNLFSKIFGWG